MGKTKTATPHVLATYSRSYQKQKQAVCRNLLGCKWNEIVQVFHLDKLIHQLEPTNEHLFPYFPMTSMFTVVYTFASNGLYLFVPIAKPIAPQE